MNAPTPPASQGTSTRPYLIRALETLLPKREPGPKRKHGNIPL